MAHLQAVAVDVIFSLCQHTHQFCNQKTKPLKHQTIPISLKPNTNDNRNEQIVNVTILKQKNKTSGFGPHVSDLQRKTIKVEGIHS